jgi:O-acetylhomoserine/O-acetylserine sulfhydrylase-like pyridoxal-dependent enzyme
MLAHLVLLARRETKILLRGTRSLDYSREKRDERYLGGHGGVITFELGLGEAETAAVVDRLKVPFMASNFGAPHTLVEQSTFFTYFEYDDAGLASIGVDRSTVRLALGYVNTADEVIADLDAALPAWAPAAQPQVS